MNSVEFERLSQQYKAGKAIFDRSLQEGLASTPVSRNVLNQIHSDGAHFFSEFEQFLVNCSSTSEGLTKSQLEDVLTSTENVLDTAIPYWSAIFALADKLQIPRPLPQQNFLNTSQRVLKTYRSGAAEKFLERFSQAGVPNGGFVSGKKIKLSEPAIDWPLAIVGLMLLGISMMVVFVFTVQNGVQYLLIRILMALGAGFALSGFTKNHIKVSYKFKGAAITALGAAAVFVLIYLTNPPAPPPFPVPSKPDLNDSSSK
jgi:hypothetical protein